MPIDPATHRPTHNTSGVEIHHHRQVKPALVGRDIRNIRRPSLVRRLGREVLLKQIIRHRVTRIPLGRDPKAPFGTAPEARYASECALIAMTLCDDRDGTLHLSFRSAVILGLP